MTWLFGPVPSRRFGRSLGIDLFTRKTCTFDCIYCEVGRTPRTTDRVQAYAPVDEVLGELERYLAEHEDDPPEVITFAGSGEPTLHRGLDEIIAGIHRLTEIPVVLLTNGSLFWRPEVLERVLAVDVLVPSLDAGCEETFRRINRPASAITFDRLTEGLLAARRAYDGHYLLEVLLVQDVNTSDRDLALLAEWVERIDPDAVQVNTVFRPPAEPGAEPATEERIARFVTLVGERAKPVAYYTKRGRRLPLRGRLLEDAIVKVVGIRPCTVEEMTDSLGVSPEAMARALARLEAAHRVRRMVHRGTEHIAIVPPTAGDEGEA